MSAGDRKHNPHESTNPQARGANSGRGRQTTANSQNDENQGRGKNAHKSNPDMDRRATTSDAFEDTAKTGRNKEDKGRYEPNTSE